MLKLRNVHKKIVYRLNIINNYLQRVGGLLLYYVYVYK